MTRIINLTCLGACIVYTILISIHVLSIMLCWPSSRRRQRTYFKSRKWWRKCVCVVDGARACVRSEYKFMRCQFVPIYLCERIIIFHACGAVARRAAGVQLWWNSNFKYSRARKLKITRCVLDYYVLLLLHFKIHNNFYARFWQTAQYVDLFTC